MLVGTGRFRVALPRKGQSMFTPNCPGWRESTATPIVCSPGGVPAADSMPGSPGGPLVLAPPQRGQPRRQGVSGPPPEREAGPSPVVAFPGRSGLYFFRQGGSASAFSPGRSARSYPESQPQSGSEIAGPSQRWAA
ncbi:hypothetical protein NDU88_001848 [Pleurodeles waltl]|uniref:Uncharacterized protein n=1 Tax=Pleurodeles waltl TaxID=8319 RepID=A0AAV7QA01_PLEWA|nr:hypothetical protein NDU88_001848 [Pleurodeles waltl]